jgi:hypothetical protein
VRTRARATNAHFARLERTAPRRQTLAPREVVELAMELCIQPASCAQQVLSPVPVPQTAHSATQALSAPPPARLNAFHVHLERFRLRQAPVRVPHALLGHISLRPDNHSAWLALLAHSLQRRALLHVLHVLLEHARSCLAA